MDEARWVSKVWHLTLTVLHTHAHTSSHTNIHNVRNRLGPQKKSTKTMTSIIGIVKFTVKLKITCSSCLLIFHIITDTL